MLNDIKAPQNEPCADPARELESREGAEDFACSPFWQQPGACAQEAPNQNAAAPPPPQLTLAQAMDLLEVETTRRREAEEGVREQEERFRQMSRYLGKFLWLSDTETNKRIYVSPGYEQVWQAKREACYSQPEEWFEDTPPSAEEGAPTAEPPAAASAKQANEYQAVGPDGSARWIRERMYPVQDATGKTLYTLGIAEDVTELKDIESAFAQSKVMERAFLRLAPDTLCKVSSEGVILEFKAAKEDETLRPRNRLRGKNLRNLLPEPLHRKAMQTLQRALSTGRLQTLCARHEIAGVMRHFEVRCVACSRNAVLALARELPPPEAAS